MKTGQHRPKQIIKVVQQAEKDEQSIAAAVATDIWLVQDNLTTHNTSSFGEHLRADGVSALAECFEFISTPKRASWIDTTELEFAVITASG